MENHHADLTREEFPRWTNALLSNCIDKLIIACAKPVVKHSNCPELAVSDKAKKRLLDSLVRLGEMPKIDNALREQSACM